MKKLMTKYHLLFFTFFVLSFPFWANAIRIEGANPISSSASNPQEYVLPQKINKELLTVKSIFNSDLQQNKADISETEIEEVDVQRISFPYSDTFYSEYLNTHFLKNNTNNQKELKAGIYNNFLASILPIHILNCVYRI